MVSFLVLKILTTNKIEKPSFCEGRLPHSSMDKRTYLSMENYTSSQLIEDWKKEESMAMKETNREIEILSKYQVEADCYTVLP